MTPERIEQERAKFEKNIPESGITSHKQRLKSGEYAYEHIEFAWKMWQARAAQSEWISVEEELPECDCRVYLDIVYIDEEGERTIGEGLYVPNVGFSFIKPTVRGGELDWDECEINTVTHWKYSDTLPPLPKGDSA